MFLIFYPMPFGGKQKTLAHRSMQRALLFLAPAQLQAAINVQEAALPVCPYPAKNRNFAILLFSQGIHLIFLSIGQGHPFIVKVLICMFYFFSQNQGRDFSRPQHLLQNLFFMNSWPGIFPPNAWQRAALTSDRRSSFRTCSK